MASVGLTSEAPRPRATRILGPCRSSDPADTSINQSTSTVRSSFTAAVYHRQQFMSLVKNFHCGINHASVTFYCSGTPPCTLTLPQTTMLQHRLPSRAPFSKLPKASTSQRKPCQPISSLQKVHLLLMTVLALTHCVFTTTDDDEPPRLASSCVYSHSQLFRRSGHFPSLAAATEPRGQRTPGLTISGGIYTL